MPNKKDLARTDPAAAAAKAALLFGEEWPVVVNAWPALLAQAAGAEERRLQVAHREAAALLTKAAPLVAEARRLLLDAEVRTYRWPEHAEEWMTLVQPVSSARDLDQLVGLIATVEKRARGFAEHSMRLWPKPTRRGAVDLVGFGPTGRGAREAVGAYAARMALVRAVVAKAPDVVRTRTPWALAGIALGLDAPCPHTEAGDRRWAKLGGEWKAVLARAVP